MKVRLTHPHSQHLPSTPHGDSSVPNAWPTTCQEETRKSWIRPTSQRRLNTVQMANGPPGPWRRALTVCSVAQILPKVRFSLFQASFGEMGKFVNGDGQLMSWACIPRGHPVLLNEESLSVGITRNAWGQVTASCRWGQVKRSRSPGVVVLVHGEVRCTWR